MLKNSLKLMVPPIFIIGYRKILSLFLLDKLFDGEDGLFKKEVSNIDVYGEYGCGQSTRWVLKNSSAYIISVDTSFEWIKLVQGDSNANDQRLKIHHVDLGAVGSWGRPMGYQKHSDFPKYTDFMWHQNKKPSLVLVDGRFRVCCFLTSLKFADEGAKIIFDDYCDRPHYHFVEKYVPRSQVCGRQCLFVVPNKKEIDLEELERDIWRFRFVMD